MNTLEQIKQAACKLHKKSNPGEGRGHGPQGKPIGKKGMVGEEKTAFDLAYEEGVKLALDEYLKTAQGYPGGVAPMRRAGSAQPTQTQAVAGPAAAKGPYGNMPGPKAVNMPAPKLQGQAPTPAATAASQKTMVASR